MEEEEVVGVRWELLVEEMFEPEEDAVVVEPVRRVEQGDVGGRQGAVVVDHCAVFSPHNARILRHFYCGFGTKDLALHGATSVEDNEGGFDWSRVIGDGWGLL